MKIIEDYSKSIEIKSKENEKLSAKIEKKNEKLD